MSGSSFGKYRLVAELGNGGMADVFLAVQAGPTGSRFKKLMVVKRLRRGLAEEPEFVAMLIDEARIAARLNHPNVVQTNEVGEVDGQFFIAMEYLDGQPLHRIQQRAATRVSEGKPTPVNRDHLYLIVLDTLAGIHHAHELTDFDGTPLDIVHRDITPHNIFVTYEGQVKVVDFGIAKAAGRSSETREGVVKGKVRYMAPEQAMGRSVDRRADIFSVGVILWEAATGRRLWKGMDDTQVISALFASDLPPSPRTIDPAVPESIDRMCQRAMSPRASDRYTTAEEFRVELEQGLADMGVLLEARRRLAPAVSELFKDRREQLRGVIESQLAALELASSGEFTSMPPVPLPSESGSLGLPIPSSTPSRTALTMPSAAPQVVEEAPTLLAAPGAPPVSKVARIRRVATIAAVAAALGATAIVSYRRVPANLPAKNDLVATQISFRLTGSPSTAKAIIDDAPAQSLPVDVKLPRDDREHRLRIEADGFIGRTEIVRFDRDLALAVDLTPLPAAAAASSGKKSKNPASVVTVVTVTRPAPGGAQARPEPATQPQPVAQPAPMQPTPAPPDGRRKADQLDKGDPWGSK